MKRKITLALFVSVFLSLSSISFGANFNSPKVGLSQDLIYFVMPDRYKDGDRYIDVGWGFRFFVPTLRYFVACVCISITIKSCN